MYDDPMEYQRTKRSYIHDEDTGLSNEDDDDNDDDIGDEGFYDEDEDEEDKSDRPVKSLKDPGSSVLHKKDEIHQVHANATGQQQPLNMEEDGKSPDEAGSSDDDEGSSSGSGSAEVMGERSYAR